MNELQVFNNPIFGSVRTIETQGQVWFCGRDSALALGFKNTVNALKQHCKPRGVTIRSLIDSIGRKQEAKFINEPK